MSVQLPITDKNFVEKIIPQKKPFVMVDSLLEYTDESLKSGYTVEESNIFVENGVFQAPGILEHQAQSVALHTGYQYFMKNEEPPVGYIGAVKTFTVETLPTSGDRLETSIRIISEIMGVTLVKTETKIGEIVVAESEMKTVIKP